MFKLNNMAILFMKNRFLQTKAGENNTALFGDERRSAGSKIDVIMKDKKYKLKVAVVEVSGPPSKVNNTHFLDDRNKICKNLKAMHKYIISKMEVPDATLKKKLKLFGFRLYQNQVYVYSLCKPCEDYYTFSLNITFPIPGANAILEQELPTFIKNIYILQEAVEITCRALDELFRVSPLQKVLQEIREDLSPNCFPHKTQPAATTTTLVKTEGKPLYHSL